MSVLRIVHTTRFTYGQEVPSSYNEARLSPAWLPRQRVLDSKIDISPVSWRTTYRDYWETEVLAFEVTEPHSSLTVTARSEVEVMPHPAKEERLSWVELTGPMLQDLLVEYLVNSPTTQPTAELADVAKEFAATMSPDEAARAICDHLFKEVTYLPGSTGVHTPARDAWEDRSGVCQDFAHLATGALRSIGIPARYVSGYLHPNADAAIGEEVQGESHAWLEWWTGDWYGFDPTNDREVGDHHVVVARAREYKDVPPLSGVFGGKGSDLSVDVRITHLS